jgi:hypothetical protein
MSSLEDPGALTQTYSTGRSEEGVIDEVLLCRPLPNEQPVLGGKRAAGRLGFLLAPAPRRSCLGLDESREAFFLSKRCDYTIVKGKRQKRGTAHLPQRCKCRRMGPSRYGHASLRHGVHSRSLQRKARDSASGDLREPVEIATPQSGDHGGTEGPLGDICSARNPTISGVAPANQAGSFSFALSRLAIQY